MTRRLTLNRQDRNGERPIKFNLRRMYNLGRTLRDSTKQQRHLDELAELGIQVPKIDKLPMIYPISNWALSFSDQISVQGEATSGEVEMALLVGKEGVLVGVASDHTDRSLEAFNIGWSKQVCPNVMSRTVWPLEEVHDHWDTLELSSDVIRDGTRFIYQQATAAEFWPVSEIFDSLVDRIPPVGPGMLFLCGTVTTLDERIIYGDRWTIRLRDPVLNRTLEHKYQLEVLWRETNN